MNEAQTAVTASEASHHKAEKSNNITITEITKTLVVAMPAIRYIGAFLKKKIH